MTWTLVIAIAAFAAGWYFGRLERTGCEAWAEALFSDLGAAQAEIVDLRAELREEQDRADRIAKEATFHADSNFYLADALTEHFTARARRSA